MKSRLDGVAHGARMLPLGALLVSLTACGPSFNYIYMSKDSAGQTKTTKFKSVGDSIFCVAELVGGDEHTKLSFDLNGPFNLSDNDMYPRPDPSKQGPVQISIQLSQLDAMGMKLEDGPWPIGSYEMGVYIDDNREDTLPFEVVP